MKKNGFTLIELLGVIVILGIISLIVVPLIQRTVVENTDTAYQDQVTAFERAARNWANANVYSLECPSQTCTNPPLKTITIQELQDEGYLETGEIINPKTNRSFNMNNVVTITMVDGRYEYNYDESQD